LAAICLVVVLVSIGGMVAAVLTGLLPGLDGLLLLLICLMMIAIFAPPLLAFVKGRMASGGKKSSEEGK
jgi:hypothetical protein